MKLPLLDVAKRQPSESSWGRCSPKGKAGRSSLSRFRAVARVTLHNRSHWRSFLGSCFKELQSASQTPDLQDPCKLSRSQKLWKRASLDAEMPEMKLVFSEALPRLSRIAARRGTIHQIGIAPAHCKLFETPQSCSQTSAHFLVPVFRPCAFPVGMNCLKQYYKLCKLRCASCPARRPRQFAAPNKTAAIAKHNKQQSKSILPITAECLEDFVCSLKLPDWLFLVCSWLVLLQRHEPAEEAPRGRERKTLPLKRAGFAPPGAAGLPTPCRRA